MAYNIGKKQYNIRQNEFPGSKKTGRLCCPNCLGFSLVWLANPGDKLNMRRYTCNDCFLTWVMEYEEMNNTSIYPDCFSRKSERGIVKYGFVKWYPSNKCHII